MINLKRIICWTPLLSGVGAAVTIGILAFMTYQTELGLWLLVSFGATTVIVSGYHDYPFAQLKNVFFLAIYYQHLLEFYLQPFLEFLL